MSTLPTAIVVVILTVASGCIPVLYTPDSETEHNITQIPAPENIVLTIGPRRFLESLAEDVVRRESRIVIRPALDFRDAVFPDGDWTLANLYAAETERRIQTTQADFLVVLGAVSYTEDASHNKWWAGTGLYDVDVGSGLSALVIDLADSRALDLLVAKSDATVRGVGVIFSVMVFPRTDQSVMEGIADELAIVLRNAKSTGPIRVVFMAAESANGSDDPLGPR